MDLFRVSFLNPLDIYKVYFKSCQHGYKDQETYFLCEKVTAFVCHRVL